MRLAFTALIAPTAFLSMQGYLHQAADRITGHAQMMFHADLGRVLDARVDLYHRERGFPWNIDGGNEGPRSHGTRYTDFSLATDFRS